MPVRVVGRREPLSGMIQVDLVVEEWEKASSWNAVPSGLVHGLGLCRGIFTVVAISCVFGIVAVRRKASAGIGGGGSRGRRGKGSAAGWWRRKQTSSLTSEGREHRDNAANQA